MISKRWRTHLVLRHDADLLRQVCEEVVVTDVLVLSEVGVEDRIQELLLQHLPAYFVGFAAEAVGTDSLANGPFPVAADVNLVRQHGLDPPRDTRHAKHEG